MCVVTVHTGDLHVSVVCGEVCVVPVPVNAITCHVVLPEVDESSALRVMSKQGGLKVRQQRAEETAHL